MIKVEKIGGPAEISGIARPLSNNAEYAMHPAGKIDFFSKKSNVFLPPEGPDARNFCLETLMFMLLKNNKSCRFRQQMLFSASDQF